jgi:hypothetical protein
MNNGDKPSKVIFAPNPLNCLKLRLNVVTSLKP